MDVTIKTLTEADNKFQNKKVIITDFDGNKYIGIYEYSYDNDFNDKIEISLSKTEFSSIGIPVKDIDTIELAE